MKKILISVTIVLILLTACSKNQNDVRKNQNTSLPTQTPITYKSIDVNTVRPNEAGKIMIVMFHNFVETFTATKWDKGEYTTTFNDFEKLLNTLYNKGYRLISLKDYLENNISVEAGCIPIIFTFDDGTSGQFNLIKQGGKYVTNPKSAVGIMEKFHQIHPDFGLKGIFFVNPGLQVFNGEGTLSNRLKSLTAKGFEIGNHTLTHVHLNHAKSADEVTTQVGASQKRISEILPSYKMYALALPFGETSKSFSSSIAKGIYEGTEYENLAILEVGWDPETSPISKKFHPLALHRVRASGIKPVETDLEWWLKNLSRKEQYISDGNPNTTTIPKSKENEIDKSKAKKLIVY